MESMESLNFMVSMGHHRDALDYSEYHWMSGTPLQFHGIPYYCMETDRISKESNWIPRNFNSMGFHGVPGDVFAFWLECATSDHLGLSRDVASVLS